MNAEGLRRIVLNLVNNFVSFAPLGTVLVALLGRRGCRTRRLVDRGNPRDGVETRGRQP